VKLWSYETEGFAKTGLQFCGLMMGDHSKCGINTMFNTGTVLVSANILAVDFVILYLVFLGRLDFPLTLLKAFETARIVMSRRNGF
jgi:hypothetical protein